MSRFERIAARVAKGAASGVVEVRGGFLRFRTRLGSDTLEGFVRRAEGAADDFEKRLGRVVEDATGFRVPARKVRAGGVTVDSFRGEPGVVVAFDVRLLSDGEKWRVLEMLEESGYGTR